MSLLNISELRLRVASASNGGTVEARLDSPTGELVGTVDVAGTGGWQTWETVTMPIVESADRGTHELFLVFRNPEQPTGIVNLNFLEFAGKGVSLNSRPEVGAEASTTKGEAPLPVDFTGTATDYDGDDLSYAWDFGVPGTDADTATTRDASWTYEQPGTYTARFTATDPKGASDTATVTVQVLPTCSGVPDPTDEFDGDMLDLCRWNAIVREDLTRYAVADGALTLTTTRGDIWMGSNVSTTSNIMLQSADRAPSEDYVMETRMSATYTDGWSQGGLMVYGDDDNYVKFDVIADGGQGRINRVELRSEVDGAIADPTLDVDVPANVSSYQLRLSKSGADYTGEVAFDGGDWITVATVPNPTADMGFGLYAFGGDQPDRTATFEYFRVADGASVNDAPVADDDAVVTTPGTPVDVNVLENDTDRDGDALVVSEVGAPAHGTATLNDDGTVRYTPEDGFEGEDTFDYTVSDGRDGTDTGTVTVTVDGTTPVVEGLSPKRLTRERTPTIVATVSDDGSGVDPSGITLFVDGEVVETFDYDAERERLTYVVEEPLSYDQHVVKIVAEDRAGNSTTTTWQFKVLRR
jgi:PKD repeat protein